MTEVRNIVALCMKYMFYFILFMILLSFCVNILEYFGVRFISVKSERLFFISALLVCISPFLWALLFITGYLFKKAYKAAFMGLVLLIMLIFSFIMKSIG